jgi:hypothetical protein
MKSQIGVPRDESKMLTGWFTISDVQQSIGCVGAEFCLMGLMLRDLIRLFERTGVMPCRAVSIPLLIAVVAISSAESSPSAAAARRQEALEAMRLIDDVLRAFPSLRSESPSWEDLATSSGVARLRNEAGVRGDPARRMQWGRSEPLPGWRISFRTSRLPVQSMGTRQKSTYSVTDRSDPCSFEFSSTDPRVVPPGRPELL